VFVTALFVTAESNVCLFLSLLPLGSMAGAVFERDMKGFGDFGERNGGSFGKWNFIAISIVPTLL
jgi:hypothetical protein